MTNSAKDLDRQACELAGLPCPRNIGPGRWLRVLSEGQQRAVHKWYVFLID